MKKGMFVLLALTLVGGCVLLSNNVMADDSAVVTASITVPTACTMTGTGTTHAATLSPGTYSGASGNEYENGIGKTTLTAICNDDNGFAIYAIGYTGNSYDSENHTKLVGSTTGGTIATKAYASGDTTSNWSMKLTKVTDATESYNPQNLTIATSYDVWHAIPDTLVRVVQYKANTGSSTTDTTLGVKLETTYAAFIAQNQPADTYVGQVKYTMVHPYDEQPLLPQTATSGCINYFPNGSNIKGAMGCQEITDSDTSITLLASNFSRQGYGFAGWSNKYDYATNPTQEGIKFYGPQEDITFTAGEYTGDNDGLALYAVWIKSQGNLQDSSKVATLCNGLTQAPTDGTANLSSVSALTDQRDNETYAIAKLADGNCWIIENLRLESTNSDNSTGVLAQGYGKSSTYGNFSGLANAESDNFTNTNPPVANSLYSTDGSTDNTIQGGGSSSYYARMPRYNNRNTQSRSNNPTTNEASMYSYGNYYTWAAALANIKEYTSSTSTDDESKTSETAGTSLCPTGWRLPYGRRTGNGAKSGGFSNLDKQLGGTGTGSYSSSNPTGTIMSSKWRSYPNNFLYSGDFTSSYVRNKGGSGSYWSSTAYGRDVSYYLALNITSVKPGIDYISRTFGFSVRCTIGF